MLPSCQADTARESAAAYNRPPVKRLWGLLLPAQIHSGLLCTLRLTHKGIPVDFVFIWAPSEAEAEIGIVL